jgi:hypothetical protein
MEPNDEGVIRRKIQEAEQSQVMWNKELVWSSIDRKPTGKSRMLAFYYVAASFTLAIALFIFSTERTKQKELALQLATLELAIEKQRTLPILTKPLLATLADCNEERPIAPVANVKKYVPATKKTPNIKKEETRSTILLANLNTSVTEKEPVIETTALATPAPKDQSTNQPTETVAAIIGTDWKSFPAKSSKEKRLQFRLFQLNEEQSFSKSTSDPVYILAHINQH